MAIGQRTGAPEGSATEQAQHKVQDVAQQAQRQTRRVAWQARERIRGQVDQRSTQAGERIAGQAGDLRSVADQLRGQGKDKPAEIAERAAHETERMAAYLRYSDAERMLGDAEDFARRKPWAVVAGGFALGFAASRFLKASSAERYEQSERWREPVPPPAVMPPAEVAGPVSPDEGYAPVTPDPGDAYGRPPATDW